MGSKRKRKTNARIRQRRKERGRPVPFPSSGTLHVKDDISQTCTILDTLEEETLVFVTSQSLEPADIGQIMEAAFSEGAPAIVLPIAQFQKVLSATGKAGEIVEVAMIEAGRLKTILRAA